MKKLFFDALSILFSIYAVFIKNLQKVIIQLGKQNIFKLLKQIFKDITDE